MKIKAINITATKLLTTWVPMLLTACSSASSLNIGWASEAEKLARLMPEGCTPIKGMDRINAGKWEYMQSRNQITCREKVPEAVWPHPNVPKPRWPALKRVPHELDLTQATGEEGDKITQAYFRHVCDTEAGDWFFKKVSTDEPPSLFNMRPRYLFAEIRHSERSYDDRYWMQAPALAGANPHNAFLFDYIYKGQRSYVRKSFHGDIGGVLQKKYYILEYDEANQRRIEKLRTDPPRADLSWVEKSLAGVPVLERPVDRQIEIDLWPLLEKGQRRERNYAYQFPYYRYVHAQPELQKVTLASGEEVLAEVAKPVPECDNDAWKTTPSAAVANSLASRAPVTYERCLATYGSQNLRVSGVYESKARFGMVWREFFVSEHDLRLSIRGTDLMVVDMRNGEVIAHSRAFTKTVPTEPHVPIFRGPLVKNHVYTCVGEASMSIVHEAINGITRLSNKTGKPIPYSSPPVSGDPLITRN